MKVIETDRETDTERLREKEIKTNRDPKTEKLRERNITEQNSSTEWIRHVIGRI